VRTRGSRHDEHRQEHQGQQGDPPEIPSVTTRVISSVTRLPSTPDSVSLNARCAPMTSL